jgi:hypothetical protein
MDVKELVGLDMLMPKHIIEHFPDDIFDNEVKPLISPRKQHMSPMKLGKKSAAFGIAFRDEFNKFSFDSLSCKEDNCLGMSVAEDKAVESGAISVEHVGCDVKLELDDDCIDVETISEQIPGEYTISTINSSKKLTENLPPLKVTALVNSIGFH